MRIHRRVPPRSSIMSQSLSRVVSPTLAGSTRTIRYVNVVIETMFLKNSLKCFF